MSRRLLAALLLTTALAVPASAAVTGPAPTGSAVSGTPTPGRTDSTWTEEYVPSGDGVTSLHADVLRPLGLADTDRTPVLLTVSPYTNHSNQAATDLDPTASGPSRRFYDFLDLSGALSKGYTYVIVDLPGQGGSGGCDDWGGPDEQRAVKTAVEWAAAQPWSTGKVGMLGKSYDGWTGLMGVAQHPRGLAAVVSMEPVYSGYRYEYSDGVRFTTSLLEGPLFGAIDLTPGTVNDTPQYQVNGAPQGYCLARNSALEAGLDSPAAPFWTVRDLVPTARAATTPLFLTQGFLEDNTKPDAAFSYFSSYAGPKHAWFGQHEHVRGYDVDAAGRHLNGRTEFVAEVMAFYDHWLKGAPAPTYPTVEVQSGDGSWRGEDAWPTAPSTTTVLNPGSYVDDAQSDGSGGDAPSGVWTASQVLDRGAYLAGEPVLSATVTTQLRRATLTTDLYDVAPDGKGVLVSRGAMLLRNRGTQHVVVPMYGQDWPVAPGHRLAVVLTSSNAEWWVDVPTMQTVTVDRASLELPLLAHAPHGRPLEGTSTPRLDDWKDGTGVATLTPEQLGATAPFTLP